MIGKGGRQSVQDMGVECHILVRIAEEGVKLAKHWVVPLITPREASILKMDFLELAGLQSSAEPVNPTSINISLVFVMCTIDLIEVS